MSDKARILIVEDETAIRNGLVDVFVYHGYQVDWRDHGGEGCAQALSGRYDLLLLDVMLPGMNGFEICSTVREQDRDVAIIMLTARDTDEDVLTGFNLGADDYVAKPFSVAQLMVRVQAVLRRTRPQQQHQRLTLSPRQQIDLTNLCLLIGNDTVPLSRREADVLGYLAQHSERPVPREELLHKVWGYAQHLDIETRTVDIHIAKLRRKLEADPSNPQFLVTVRGAGYRLLLTDHAR
ncbi:MAG: response regulator transcription factor [Wenzhouxiangellaceae bacterium]